MKQLDTTAAACREEDPELFFPIGISGPAQLQAERARAVCRRCPLKDACLDWALETGQDFGIWGGMTEDERRLHMRKRRPEDAPKHRWTNAAELHVAGETKEQIAVRLKLTPRTVEKYLKLAEQ